MKTYYEAYFLDVYKSETRGGLLVLQYNKVFYCSFVNTLSNMCCDTWLLSCTDTTGFAKGLLYIPKIRGKFQKLFGGEGN